MAGFGLCASYPLAMPEVHDLDDLGMADDWVRIFTYSFDQLQSALDFLPSTAKVVVTINNQWAEVGWDWANWVPAMQEFARRFRNERRIKIVQLINEPDIWFYQPPVGQPDLRLTPAWCADRVIEVIPTLWGAGFDVALPSVASGQWAAYLTRMAQIVHATTDSWARPPGRQIYADFHGYAKSVGGYPDPTWQALEDGIRTAYGAAGYPVIMSECGIKVSDAGGVNGHARWVGGAVSVIRSLPPEILKVGCLFCWSDKSGSPGEHGDQGFGLIDDEGNRRPAWYTVKSLMQPAEPAPPPEPTPMPVHNHAVGPGVLTAMQQDGTLPASCELYYPLPDERRRLGIPLDAPAEYSETMGRNGVAYRYLFDTGVTHRFSPLH